MELKVRLIGKSEPEYVEIGCHEETEDVKRLERYVSSLGGMLTGYSDGAQVSIPVSSVFYFESVDDRCFIYCADKTYESKLRLHELEARLTGGSFVRISKSVVLDLMKVSAIKPALNGRYACLLTNGEGVIISRKYVADIKNKLRGEAQ